MSLVDKFSQGMPLWSPPFLAASLHKPKLGNACPNVVPRPLSAEFTLLALWPGLINEQNNKAERPTRCLEMRNKCVRFPQINLWASLLTFKILTGLFGEGWVIWKNKQARENQYIYSEKKKRVIIGDWCLTPIKWKKQIYAKYGQTH